MASDDGGDLLLVRARDAAAHGDSRRAFDLFLEADSDGSLGLADLADACRHRLCVQVNLDVTIETWERVYAGPCVPATPPRAGSAAVRVAMHLLFDTALMAPVRGWLARAEQLLQDGGETSAHAWLAVVRTFERMLTGDLHGARHWARRAIEVGSMLTRRRPPSDGWRKRGC